MKLPKIIGIAGTNGAGKDTLGELLAERSGYLFRSASDILRDELTRQGLPHERKHLGGLSTSWAKQFGPAVLVEKTIEFYLSVEPSGKYDGLAIGSIRRTAEAKAIQERGGLIVWVDAEPRTRYERTQLRGRSETDILPFEEWVRQENAEMTAPPDDDGSAMNMAGVREMADVHITNDFDSFEAYREFLIKEYEL